MRIFCVYDLNSWWGAGLPPDVLHREDAGGMAGGETYMLELAFGLAAAGHKVDLFSGLIKPGAFQGVGFHSYPAYAKAIANGAKPDVVIAFLQPFPLQAAPVDSVRLFAQQCNHMDFGTPWWTWTDGVIAASNDHIRHLSSYLVWKGPFYAVHNGCAFDRYPAPDSPLFIKPADRKPIVGYWSSPDRGLHHLLAAWPYVLRERPDAQLRIHYEIERLLKMIASHHYGYVPHLGQRMLMMRDRVNAARLLPSVTFTGMLSKPQMIRMQCETRVMCYPLDPIAYTEGMGGSVSEAMAAGCLPLVRGVDAFPSVYDGGVRWVAGHPEDPQFNQKLGAQIVEALDWTGTENPTLGAARAVAERWSWTNAQRELRDVIEKAVALKRGG